MGIDTIQLQKDSDVPVYVQLYNALKEMLVDGVLREGTRLPAIRKLAQQLEVNNITIVSAYRLLEQEGYINSRQGSGSYVAKVDAIITPAAVSEISPSSQNKPDFGTVRIGPDTINFASATPTPELFQIGDFKEVINEVLERDKGYAFGYQESQGYLPLREAVADYVATRGVKCESKDIHVISGAQQGIDVLCKALLGYGDYVFTETPTYNGALAAFRSRGVRIIEIPMENDGIDIKELERQLKLFRPRFIYTMPTLQNPTGATYSLLKKKRLLAIAAKYDISIVEDDYLGELDYSDAKTAPLKALDRENRVIYIKSFSKMFMPGLRIAFLLVPESLHPQVLAAKHTADISTSGLTQRMLDLYLRRGIWTKHINAMKEIYRARYMFMKQRLQAELPAGIRFFDAQGGLTFWLTLPAGLSARMVYDEVARHDVLIVPGEIFYAKQHDDTHIRLSFAATNLAQIEKGIAILGQTITDCMSEAGCNRDTILPFV